MKQEKWTTIKIKKQIMQGEEELARYKAGSTEWCQLFAQIEYLRDELK